MINRHTIGLAALLLLGACQARSPFDISTLDEPAFPIAPASSLGESGLSLALGESTSTPKPAGPAQALPAQGERAPEAPPPQARSLSSLVDEALRRNPATRAAWERASAAAAAVGAAQSENKPQISLETGVIEQRAAYEGTNEFIIAQGPTASLGLAVSWLIVDFGRTDADVARARKLLEAANDRYTRKVQELVYEVQRTYFALDAAVSMREAAEEDLENARLQMESVEAQLAVGLATLPQALEARRAFAAARYELELAEADVYDGKAALSVAVGVPPERDLAIEPLEGRELPGEVEAGLELVVQAALTDRPDLGEAVSRVQAAEAAVRRADAEFLPELFFIAEGSVSWYDQRLSESATGPSGKATGFPYGGSVGLQGSWLLYDGGERESMLRVARAERAAAQEDLAQLRLTVSGEVWGAYFDLIASRRGLEAAESLLEASRASFEAVREGFVTGLNTLPDLLDAEALLADARDARIRARAQLLDATARLALAAGS